MNLMIQNMKRLLSGIFAGGVFFCACAQDIITDTDAMGPAETVKLQSIEYEKDKIKNLLEFSKVFSLRMVQTGKAAPADISNVLRLLEKDPDSLQLNIMLQNMLTRAPQQLRTSMEKQYCELAEKNPASWIMQTFSAEILLKNKKTVSKGLSRLYQVFQQNLLNKGNISSIQQKDLQTFRQTLLSRLLLLTFVHKKNDQYNVISEFIRKNPHYRKQPDLLADWLLTCSGKRENSGPLPVLPGAIIPSEEINVLRNFHICKRELLDLISKGNLPSGRKCVVILSVFNRWKQNAELKNALLQYLKTAKSRHWEVYTLLGDLTNGTARAALRERAMYYRKALLGGLSYYDRRALHLAGLYIDLKDLKNAEQLLEQITRKAPKVNTVFHYIALYSAKKDYKQALKKIALLPPGSFIRFQQEAYMRTFMKDYRGAYKAMEQAWQAAKKKKLKFRDLSFLYLSVEIAEKCKNIKKVKELLEPAIKKNPRNMELKNALGYILADHNTGLQQAYTLLKEVVSVSPDNGAFLDSMAWVLYRLKRFEEAKKYILQALKYHKDRVILDHAGDIFYALKDHAAAEKYWRMALMVKGEVKTEVILLKLRNLHLDKNKRKKK